MLGTGDDTSLDQRMNDPVEIVRYLLCGVRCVGRDLNEVVQQ